MQERKVAVNQKEQRKRFKKKKRVKRIAKWTSLIVLILGTIIFAMVSPIFNITEFEVINNSQLSSDTIISLSGLKKDQNIFRFLKSDVINKIKENPYVESVTINRQLPNKIQFDVEERQRNYSVQFLNEYAYINNQGYILELSEDSLGLTIIKGIETPEEDIQPGNRLCTNDLEKLETVIEISNLAKEDSIEDLITSIDISNKNEYILYLEQEKKEVDLGDDSNLNTKMLYVKSIIEKEAGNEGKIYFIKDSSNKLKACFRETV